MLAERFWTCSWLLQIGVLLKSLAVNFNTYFDKFKVPQHLLLNVHT